MLALAENITEQEQTENENNDRTEASTGEPTINNNTTYGDGQNPEELCAVPKAAKGKGGKGYGQCWECGEMGHPRR